MTRFLQVFCTLALLLVFVVAKPLYFQASQAGTFHTNHIAKEKTVLDYPWYAKSTELLKTFRPVAIILSMMEEPISVTIVDPQEAVTAHNNYRAQHRVGGLVWDSNLASYAANWAGRCNFDHSGGPYGENLFLSSPTGSFSAAVEDWYNEGSQYDYNNPGFSEGTGHFTQVVWKGTTRLGCALAQCSFGVYVVCEYSPPGNVIGQFPGNVLRPI